MESIEKQRQRALEALVERAPLIVDTRNALRGYTSPKIVRL